MREKWDREEGEEGIKTQRKCVFHAWPAGCSGCSYEDASVLLFYIFIFCCDCVNFCQNLNIWSLHLPQFLIFPEIMFQLIGSRSLKLELWSHVEQQNSLNYYSTLQHQHNTIPATRNVTSHLGQTVHPQKSDRHTFNISFPTFQMFFSAVISTFSLSCSSNLSLCGTRSLSCSLPTCVGFLQVFLVPPTVQKYAH